MRPQLDSGWRNPLYIGLSNLRACLLLQSFRPVPLVPALGTPCWGLAVKQGSLHISMAVSLPFRAKKDTAPSTSSSHGEVAHSKVHKDDEKLHRPSVSSTEHCTPSGLALLRSSNLWFQGSPPFQFQLVPTEEHVLLTLGRLESAPCFMNCLC